MADPPTRRLFLQGLASTMFDLYLNDGERRIRYPTLCERICGSVARDGRPRFLEPRPLKEFVSPSVLGESGNCYRGRLVIGTCQHLGAEAPEVLEELCRGLSLELDERNRGAIVDLMQQLWLHDEIDKRQPATVYATDTFVSSRFYIKERIGFSQHIDFPRRGLKELKASTSLEVELRFSRLRIIGQPPLVIRPGEWSLVKPKNRSSLIDFHHFANTRRLFRSGVGAAIRGGASPGPPAKIPVLNAITYVNSFIPADGEDGRMMELVCAGRREYAYHEIFGGLRFGACLRMRVMHLARFLKFDGRGAWINQVNVAFDPATSQVLDINTRSQHFEYWAPHHVGLKQILETYAKMWP